MNRHRPLIGKGKCMTGKGKPPFGWDDSSRADRVGKFAIVRTVAAGLAELINTYSLAFSTRKGLPGRAATLKKQARNSNHNMPQQNVPLSRDMTAITEAPMVVDLDELERTVPVFLHTIRSCSDAHRRRTKLPELLSDFLEAVRQERDIRDNADRVTHFLDMKYHLRAELYLDHVRKLLTHQNTVVDVICCYSGAAALAYYYVNRRRYVLRKEIIKNVPACGGSIRSVDNWIAMLPKEQRSCLHSVNGLGTTYIG
jgi:hypothetical protein